MFITEPFPSIQNSDYYILHENFQNNFVSKQKKMQFKGKLQVTGWKF